MQISNFVNCYGLQCFLFFFLPAFHEQLQRHCLLNKLFSYCKQHVNLYPGSSSMMKGWSVNYPRVSFTVQLTGAQKIRISQAMSHRKTIEHLRPCAVEKRWNILGCVPWKSYRTFWGVYHGKTIENLGRMPWKNYRTSWPMCHGKKYRTSQAAWHGKAIEHLGPWTVKKKAKEHLEPCAMEKNYMTSQAAWHEKNYMTSQDAWHRKKLQDILGRVAWKKIIEHLRLRAMEKIQNIMGRVLKKKKLQNILGHVL